MGWYAAGSWRNNLAPGTKLREEFGLLTINRVLFLPLAVGNFEVGHSNRKEDEA